MKLKALLFVAILGVIFTPWARTQAPADALPVPGFHHLHLNATNPEAAIEFYTRQFPSTSKTTFAGQPALKTGKYFVLFNRVTSPPLLAPQTAIWHFGWHVTDVRNNLEMYLSRKGEVKLLPLYTTDTDPTGVWVSSDTYPGGGGPGGALGRTKEQLAEAKAKDLKPAGGAGFAYLQGPDGAIIEYQGNMPAERFNHVHMYQEDPVCAQLWYQKHFNVRAGGRGPVRTEADCKTERGEKGWPALEREAGTIRVPTAGVTFDDVALNWYMRQGNSPLVSTRGHLADHFALSVANLDPWIAKLKAEGVKFLIEQPYKLGDSRAVMVEGPSREAIELVEVK